MGKKKNVEVKEQVAEVKASVKTEDAKSVKYVVVREGYRVSDKEYEVPTDAECVAEKEFWTKVSKKHSYGEPVAIVEYDAKKHRVW